MEHKPWLKKDGTLKSEAEIKESCKNWDPCIWEAYLQTLEVEQKEIITETPLNLEEYSQEEHDKYGDIIGCRRNFPILQKHLLEAMKSLTGKQQKVLHKLFWEHLKLREVSEEMDIAISSVALMRDRALKQLGIIMIDNLVFMSRKTFRKKCNSPDKKVNREKILLDDPVCREDHSQKDHEDQKNNIVAAKEFPVFKNIFIQGG